MDENFVPLTSNNYFLSLYRMFDGRSQKAFGILRCHGECSHLIHLYARILSFLYFLHGLSSQLAGLVLTHFNIELYDSAALPIPTRDRITNEILPDK